MALRKSSSGSLLSTSSARKKRGSGSFSFSSSSSGATLEDYTYRQNADDYAQGIMSYEDYIAYLQTKLSGLTEGTNNYLTIDKRIRSVTDAYTNKLAADQKQKDTLATNQITADYQNGIVGFAAYSQFLSDKLAKMDPDSLEYFATQKSLDSITEQQTDKQMDYGFKTAKTIEPDDYIKWKQDLLAKTDSTTPAYLQLETDIKSAQWEAVNRLEDSAKYDVMTGVANKQDLAKFYYGVATATDDPQKQMEYMTKYSNTVDSINSEALAEYNQQVGLQDRDMALKYRRGDLGNTPQENAQVMYDYLNDRLSKESDPNKQMSLISQMDGIVKAIQAQIDQEAAKATAGYAASVASAKKDATQQYAAAKKDYKDNKDALIGMLNTGGISADQYAVEMSNITTYYLNSLDSLGANPYLDDSKYEDIDAEKGKIIDAYNTDSFWKSNKMMVDAQGNTTGKVWHDPNYKPVQGIDEQGNMKTSWKFEPSQSYKMEGCIFDQTTGVWREVVKVKYTDENGKEAERGESYRVVMTQDPVTGEYTSTIVTDYQDPVTGKWGSMGKDRTFKESDHILQDVNFHAMKGMDDVNEYNAGVTKKIWENYSKEIGNNTVAGFNKYLAEHPGSFFNNIADSPEWIKEEAGKVGGAAYNAVESFGKGVADTAVKKSIANAEMATGNYMIKNPNSALGTVLNKAADGGQAIQNASNYVAGGIKSAEKSLGNVYNSISSAAKNWTMPTSSIGGALGEVYNKRSDLQQNFDANGKGTSAAWAGKTINDWANTWGYKEESSLANYAPKAPAISIPKITATVNNTINAVKKTASDVWKYNPTVNAVKKVTAPIMTSAGNTMVNKPNTTAGKILNTAANGGQTIENIYNSAKRTANNFWNKIKW